LGIIVEQQGGFYLFWGRNYLENIGKKKCFGDLKIVGGLMHIDKNLSKRCLLTKEARWSNKTKLSFFSHSFFSAILAHMGFFCCQNHKQPTFSPKYRTLRLSDLGFESE